jgi:IS30 family transposase
MRQEQPTTKRTKVKDFTYKERVAMETLIRHHCPRGKTITWAELARLLQRHWRSVKNEYERGKTTNKTSELVEYTTYSATVAQEKTNAILAQKGPRMKLSTQHAAFIQHQIVHEKMSPYVAVTRMKTSGLFKWTPCVKTLYNAIENGHLEIIRAHLPYGKTRKKHTTTGKRMAYRTPPERTIDKRPPEAETRQEYGHWEMDTLVGGAGASAYCLLVLTERMTRMTLTCRLPNRTQKSVRRALNRLERNTDFFATIKSLTSDNGSEFWDFHAIERSVLNPKRKRCNHYYAHPYSAFERGSNENANRLIRRFIPKGADIGHYSMAQIQDIQDKINTMPREILNGLSAEQEKEKNEQKSAA